MNNCILWEGNKINTHGNSYGVMNGKKIVLAHRIAYEKYKGKIPQGYVIDHLCRNGLCVNPEHLEAVSNVENIMRGNGACAKNSRKTHCKRGHELIPENIYNRVNGKRDCRLCDYTRRARVNK